MIYTDNVLQFDNEPKLAAAHADHNRDHFIFPRTQSISMQAAEWEGRVQPIKRRAVRNFLVNILQAVAV